ncbi:general vesicular transport factor p115 [Tribolium castaneum]|uniref:General vesicular transport factor p115 n=1 Tax=Tribolium castaneum TaxID=7070 RepID=D6WWA3_TRICA|nr:PREDICTED: general vesicular transport factor p115 [Tribolium castaneum]EFA08682.1 General vesicular transport factor p115-like Protein [Tribolium castaneum]|eukprot:XP_972184.1 PREDICTED: general vesicular transport factor p115 [Tribolium castaneum]
MEYFRSGLKSVLGAPAPGTQPTGAETVERLVSRVSTSTLLEDRRDACRALKALSRKYRLEVGAQGMDVLRQVLELDRSDCEIIGYCLDTLCNITSKEVFEEESESNLNIKVNVGEQFTEMFIKNAENVTLVLSFLEEYDFRVRWPAVKLLTSLLASKPKEIQDVILVSPMGVSKLMDLLVESREVIRNDALLLLINLTKSNANIQKIVAFENAFDRLFDVIREEGFTDGGIVVEDCMLLMLNLLKNNTSNINFFKEGSYIQKLAPMFILPDNLEEVGWSPQKVSNMHCVLQLVRTLVSPTNPVQIVTSCQKTMRNANLLEALCNILMASGVPADILTETINTVGEVIRGNLTNQEYFAGVMAPSNPPRPAIVVLLMSMVNEKQPFTLRCAVLYCFQCFLFKNEIGQEQVVQTLLPSSTNSTLTTGQLLCGGLFSADSLSCWFSSVALSHTLIENPAQREQLLRVLLATNLGSQPVSLLHQCAVFLQQTTKLQAKIGILMLLAMWMSHCPQAVQVFLNVPGAMAFLTAQTSASEFDNNEEILQGLCAFLMGLCVAFNDNSVQNYSKENLSQLIEKRVGTETYCTKLGEISRHEVYAKAAKQPQIRAKHSSELLLEFEFCKLFKALEPVIIKALGVQRDLSNGMSELSLSEHENALLLQYKELIRDQDKKLQDVHKSLSNLQRENQDLKGQIEELRQTNSQLHDQNTLLKAQMQLSGTAVAEPGNDKVKQLEAELVEKDAELERLRKDQDDLLELLTDQDTKLNAFKNRLKELGETVEDGDSEDNSAGSDNEV